MKDWLTLERMIYLVGGIIMLALLFHILRWCA
jgi:hypothetical protein